MSTFGNWWNNLDDSEKFNKFEAEYSQLLMKKYFSEENIFGEKAYEKEVKIGDETIKSSSRWQCVQSYADPVQSLKDDNGASSIIIPTPSFQDPNAAAMVSVPLFEDPKTAFAPIRPHCSIDLNAPPVLFPDFEDPNPAMASVPVQSFQDPKGKSPSTWRPSG